MAKIDFSRAIIYPSNNTVWAMTNLQFGLAPTVILAEYSEDGTTIIVGTGNLGQNIIIANLSTHGYSIVYDGVIPDTFAGSSSGRRLAITNYFTSSRTYQWWIEGVTYSPGDSFCFQINFEFNC